MKRFPQRRTDTITRANVERTLAEFPEFEAAEVATQLCGKGPWGNSYAKNRHVWRTKKLMMNRPVVAREKAS